MSVTIHFVIKRALFLGLLLSLSACQSSRHIAQTEALPPSIKGVWQSNGYGYLLDLSGENVAFYSITLDHCLYSEEGSEFASTLVTGDMPNTVFRLNQDSDTISYIEAFETYPIEFYRLKGLPERCLEPIENTPKTNFDFFADYMQTHYAFFELYDVDWKQTVNQARQQVSDSMSEEDLFALFSNMLSPLKDAHLSLSGDVSGEEKRYQPETSTVGEATIRIAKEKGVSKRTIDHKLFKQYKQEIRDSILGGKGETVAHDWIQYGVVPSKLTIDKKLGYMAFMSTYNYAGKGIGHDTEDRAILTKVLDEALNLFNVQNVDAVIIDLSINVGGHSFPATDIAARFTREKHLAFSKRAYGATNQDFFPIYIPDAVEDQQSKPSNTHSHRPVYLLTANTTVSGGEELAMALRALPNVTHLGENTRGGLSDILTKTLPNGWVLELSNEIYKDPEGNVWEGDGIPPDRYLEVFDKENPFEGHLEAVNRVIELALKTD